MHRSEEGDLSSCADCGAPIDPARARGYAFGASGVLCFDCAVRRGGVYDGARDDWTTEPSVEGLERALEG